MISIDLVESLKKDLEELFSDNLDSYETKYQDKKAPKVNTGWYNKKVDKEDFPYILISPISQKESRNEARVDLMLIIGTYSKDDDGWKDTALVAERIRQFFKSRKYISNKYEIGDDLRIDYLDEQPYPVTFCAMYVNFNIYNPYNYEGGFDAWQ